MGTVKTFEIEEEDEPEPLPFQIKFNPKDKKAEPRVEKFEAYGKAHAGCTIALASIARYDKRGNQVPDMNGMMRYFELAMPPDHYNRLRDLIDDHSWQPDLDMVGNVFSWLIEEQSERPTGRSQRSRRSRPGGGKIGPGVVIELDPDSVEETSTT